METTFTAGFIGLGLIGGSIARALKKYYPDVQILAREAAIQPNTHWNMASLMRSVIQSMNDTASAITFFYVHLWNAMLLIWDC